MEINFSNSASKMDIASSQISFPDFNAFGPSQSFNGLDLPIKRDVLNYFFLTSQKKVCHVTIAIQKIL